MSGKSLLKNFVVLFLLLGYALMSISCNGQPLRTESDVIVNSPDGIQWMSFEDAISRSEKAPKKIFIDVYTSWCGWCKKMDATTFLDKDIIRYMNEKYYPVKLNAETRDTIHFREHEFKFVPEYKANELAISLLGGKMGYPSYILMDESFSLMTPPVQSYLTRDALMPILVYFGDNVFKEKTWEEYQSALPK